MFPRSSRTGDALPQARTCFSVASIEKQIEVTLLSWCKVERAAAQKRASRRSETRLKAVRNLDKMHARAPQEDGRGFISHASAIRGWLRRPWP